MLVYYVKIFNFILKVRWLEHVKWKKEDLIWFQTQQSRVVPSCAWRLDIGSHSICGPMALKVINLVSPLLKILGFLLPVSTKSAGPGPWRPSYPHLMTLSLAIVFTWLPKCSELFLAPDSSFAQFSLHLTGSTLASGFREAFHVWKSSSLIVFFHITYCI